MWRILKRWFLGGYLEEKGLINELNHTWTPIILVILSVVSAIARHVENPVECWCPQNFTSERVRYTNNYCWKTDWVYIMPKEPIDMGFRGIVYVNIAWMRWLPIVFLLQAVLFRIPGIILHAGETKLGFNRSKLCGLSDGYTKLSLEDRKSVGKQLSRYLNQWLNNRILSGLPFGFLTFLIEFVYVLYVVNVTVQLTILDKFIKHPNVTSYGTHLSHNLFENITDVRIQSPTFPRMFLCDFEIRQLQHVHHWTVQCVNNLNYVYEQIMALLYIWLLFVIVVTYCSCALKAVEVVIPLIRTRYIKQYLQSEGVVIHNESDVSRFANTFLGEDGVMVLKGIGEMSSEYLVCDAVVNLWTTNYGTRSIPRHSEPAFPQQPIMSGSSMVHQPGIPQHQPGVSLYPDSRPDHNQPGVPHQAGIQESPTIVPRAIVFSHPPEASGDSATENVPLMSMPAKQ